MVISILTKIIVIMIFSIIERLSLHLNSGRVNFMRPCSVAICSALGTASSHRDFTHRRSHLQAKTHTHTHTCAFR